MAQVSGIEIAINANPKGLQTGLNTAEKALSSFAKSAIAALGGALTVGAFAAAGKAAIDYADTIGKTAQKIGMTTEELSRLNYAAKLSDVTLGELQVGLGQLSKNMEAGSEGLAALGISATDANGNLRSTNEVMTEVAEKFAGMQDGAGKTAIAMNIFGRSGAQLIPLLNSGRDGLAQMAQEADRFGVTISGNVSRASEDFNDNLTRLKTISEGLAQELTARLLPAANKVLEGLLEYVQNSGGIEAAVDGIAREFADLSRVVSGSADGLDRLKEWSLWLDKLAQTYGPFSKNAQDGFFGAFPKKGFGLEKQFEAIESFGMDQTVNTDGKTDLASKPLSLAPSLSTGDEKKSIVPGIAPSQEVGSFFIDRLAAIQEGLMTEQEAILAHYDADRVVLENALANKLISEEAYNEASRRLAEEHAAALAQIQQTRLANDLTAAHSFFGSMASAAQSGGKKMIKVAKAMSAAQAIIATIQAAVHAMNDPTAVTPIQKFANYAAVFAKGMSAVAAIKGVSESGGGGGGKNSGGGAGAGAARASASAAPTPTTTFQFTMMNDPMGFGEKFARQFIDQLNSTQRNGGTIRGVIA